MERQETFRQVSRASGSGGGRPAYRRLSTSVIRHRRQRAICAAAAPP